MLKTVGPQVNKTQKPFIFYSQRCEQIPNHFDNVHEFIKHTHNASALLLDDTQQLKLTPQGSLVSSSKKQDYTTRTGKYFNIRSNVCFIDFEFTDTALKNGLPEQSYEQQMEFVNSINLPNYVIYRSTSYYEKGKTNRLHLFILTEKPIDYNSFKRWLISKLPAHVLLIKGSNYHSSMCDLGIYNHRPIYRYKNSEPLHIKDGPLMPVTPIIMTRKASKTKGVKEVIESRASLNDRGFFLMSDVLQYPNGEFVTVEEVLESTTLVRLTSPVDMNTELAPNGHMQYYPDTKTFIDFAHSANKRYTVLQSNIKDLEYDTQYNKLFRPITHDKIDTVEISPTGSGKTFIYQQAPMTIMVLPTTAMVIQNGGLVAGTSWHGLNPYACNYMTYDKLAGHLKERKSIAEYSIIIDEVHLLLGSTDPVQLYLIDMLFNRKVEFRELKCLSATLLPEKISLFLPKCSIFRYKDLNRSPLITFVQKIPKPLAHERTLIYYNAKIDQAIISDYLDFPNTLIINAENRPPESLEPYKLIIATQVLREGYNINETIDTLIIVNQKNPTGAMNIAQYLARPRKNTPKIYVVHSASHFIKRKQAPSLSALMHFVENKESMTEDEIALNKSLNLNRLLALAKEDNGTIRKSGVIKYFDELQVSYENSYFGGMSESLKLYSNAKVVKKSIEDKSSFKKPSRNKSIMEALKECRSFKELNECFEWLQSLSKESEAVHAKFSTIEPIRTITLFGELVERELKEEYQVMSITHGGFRSRLIQHQTNIVLRTYILRDKIRHPYTEGQIVRLEDVTKRFKVLFKDLFEEDTTEDTLEKLYRYSKLDDSLNVIQRWKPNQKNKKIRIDSLYLVTKDMCKERLKIEVEGL